MKFVAFFWCEDDGKFYLVDNDKQELPEWLSKYCPLSDDDFQFVLYKSEVSLRVTLLARDEKSGKVFDIASKTYRLLDDEQSEILEILNEY